MGHGARGLFRRPANAGLTFRTITRAAARIAGAKTGSLGICDRQGRMCFALALWNGKDPDPQRAAFRPHRRRRQPRRRRQGMLLLRGLHSHAFLHERRCTSIRSGLSPINGWSKRTAAARRLRSEFELTDTGIFGEDRYFDVQIEYAKVTPNDLLIRLQVDNRGPEAWTLHLLPTVWFRNGWSWGRHGEGHSAKPSMRRLDERSRRLRTPDAGPLHLRSPRQTRPIPVHRERD